MATKAVHSMSKAKTSSSQAPFMKRLYQDLKQLKEEPIVGANAEPLEHDMLTWYGIVLGAEGTDYAGIPIRFCLKFTDEYPNEPPKAYFETFIEYEGGGAFKDSKGRTMVCLNIFGNFWKYHPRWVNRNIYEPTDNPNEVGISYKDRNGRAYTYNILGQAKKVNEGWSPSYTVHTILISMQALFLSGMLSKWTGSIAQTRRAAADFRCPKTGHDGAVPSTWFPKVITDYNVAAAIAASSGRSGYNVLRDFYICYVKKTTAIANDNVPGMGTMLGYGIHREYNGTFSSPCEYLSRAAYADGTRRGATNKPFEYWFPILINTPYRGRFMTQLNIALDHIATTNPRQFRRASAPYAKLFKLCSSVMNNLVVEIMKNAGDMTANDKFINGYIAFYRLLISYAEVDSRMVHHANRAIRRFMAAPENRIKSAVPNLGELLIHLAIADEYNWADIAGAFMEECDARNVKWYVEDRRFYVDEFFVGARSQQVFHLTKVSRTLVMYQVKFSKIVKELTAQTLASNYGLAPDKIRFELKDTFNMVQTIESWDGFFDWVGLPRVADDVRDQQLEEAMRRSETLRYHYDYSDWGNYWNGNGNYHRGRNKFKCPAPPPANLIDLISEKLN